MIKVFNSCVSQKNLKHFDKLIDDKQFSLFLTIKSAVGKKCNPTFEHCVVKVPEFREDQFGINSGFYNFFKNIFNEFCIKNKIQYSEIYRCSVNVTMAINEGKLKSHVHTDHPYEHKSLLIYLNSPDIKSKTIYIDNKKKKYIINPKRNKGVLCDGYKHYYYYPKHGYRIVLIYTFI